MCISPSWVCLPSDSPPPAQALLLVGGADPAGGISWYSVAGRGQAGHWPETGRWKKALSCAVAASPWGPRSPGCQSGCLCSQGLGTAIPCPCLSSLWVVVITSIANFWCLLSSIWLLRPSNTCGTVSLNEIPFVVNTWSNFYFLWRSWWGTAPIPEPLPNSLCTRTNTVHAAPGDVSVSCSGNAFSPGAPARCWGNNSEWNRSSVLGCAQSRSRDLIYKQLLG